MDLSSQAIREAKFKEEWRGYNRDEVDDFLEQVADGVDTLRRRLEGVEGSGAEPASREAARGWAPAPETAPAAETPGGGPGLVTQETLSRALLLAQRAADLAMSEANQRAAQVLADARVEAERLTSHALEAARRSADEGQAQLRADVERLEAARAELANDVSMLQRFLDGERERLRAGVAAVLEALEGGLAPMPQAPVTGSVELPAAPAAPPIPAVQTVITGEAGEDEEPAPAEVVDLTGAENRPADLDEELAVEVGTDDPFLADLRRAVTDDSSLGPRDDAPSPEDEAELDLGEEDDQGVGSRLRRWR